MGKVSKKFQESIFYISFGFMYEKAVMANKIHCKEGWAVMPALELLSTVKCLISGMPDTNEKYRSISENQIIRPPGYAPCVEVYFEVDLRESKTWINFL